MKAIHRKIATKQAQTIRRNIKGGLPRIDKWRSIYRAQYPGDRIHLQNCWFMAAYQQLLSLSDSKLAKVFRALYKEDRDFFQPSVGVSEETGKLSRFCGNPIWHHFCTFDNKVVVCSQSSVNMPKKFAEYLRAETSLSHRITIKEKK